jgi:hypothetical protein
MPQRKALVVAINRYGGTGANDLPSCVNDANAFTEEVLKGLYRFRAEDIRTLLDDNATIENVEAELDRLTHGATAADRLVFYFSGHGYTQLVNNRWEEFLVLRNAAGPVLFSDDRFVAKVKDLPPGVFTAVLDMCFSGGAFKAVALDAFGQPRFEATQIKALPYPPEEMQAKTKAFSLEAGPDAPPSYKRFGCVPTDRPTVLTKMFAPEPAVALAAPKAVALSDPTEAPQPEMSGLLVSACLETETASASNSLTRGLSAFTFAMLEALGRQTTPRSAVGVFDATAAELRRLGFRQTPMLLERAVPGNLRTRAFITAIEEVPQKVFVAEQVDQKLFGAIVARLAQVIPQVAPAVLAGVVSPRKTAALTSTPYSAAAALAPASTDADEKFIGAVLGTLAQALPHVAPVVLDAITTRRKDLETSGVAPSPEDQEKFLSSVLNTVAQVVPHVTPMILEAIRTRRKELEAAGLAAPMAAASTEEKFLGAILGAVGSVIPRVAPLILDAVVSRRKELEGLPADTSAAALQGDPKFITAVLDTLGQVIPHVAPLVLDALTTRRKALAGIGPETGLESDEKFLGSIFSTMASAVRFIVPRVVDAAVGRPKELEGVALGTAISTDADEKFLGAIVGTLSQVIPHVAPIVIDAVLARRKELEVETGIAFRGDGVDEKLLPFIVGAVASAIPHVAPLIVDAVRSRRKELEEGVVFGGLGGAQIEEKLFADILRHTRQVFTCFAGLPAAAWVPASAARTIAPAKAMEPGLAEAPATAPEVDEKFLGAVVSALGRVLPAVAPAIIEAVTARRKEALPALSGLGAPAAAETDEKMIGAIVSVLGRVIPAVTPTILDAVIGRRKEIELAPASATAAPADVDEKFIGAVVSALGRVLPAVTPVILDAVRAQRKAVAGTGGSADDRIVEETMNRLREQMPQWFGTSARPAW